MIIIILLFRYPYIASEIFSLEIMGLINIFFDDKDDFLCINEDYFSIDGNEKPEEDED